MIRVLTARLVTHIRWGLLHRKMPCGLRQAYTRDGYCIVPGFLDEKTLSRIKEELCSVTGEARQMVQGNTATQRILLDSAFLAPRPHLSHLANDRKFGNLLSYAGAKAVAPLLYIQRIRNGYHEGGADPQKTMHSDTFHPTMKAWLFLTDVEDRHGPFTYVKGSHKLTLARFRWEYRRSCTAGTLHDGYSEKGSFRANAEDLNAMGLPSPEGITAKAGTLVIANTNGFHGRGQAENGEGRTEIWAYSRHNPFNPLPGFGLKAVGHLEHFFLKAYWRFKDKQAKKRGVPSSWHLIDAQDMLDGK
ncbi:phytanoyl-CoA dioxygenase family protein [Kordiimonas sp.]|uniref:phytanoyl-CoA dioxygenase family protein n=1 Tax=Kordiimonas sp. TaxID=1970157 RepID=UPI003A8D3DFF